MKIADFISRHMAVEVLLGALVALALPGPVAACLKPAYIPWLLGAVMFGMAGSAERILDNLGLILVAVILHNLLGFASGYATGRLFGMDPARRRTLAIEVGMQNSGLAVSLAHTHFAAYPLAAVPGALFSVWHNLSGSLFAALCRKLDERNAKKK